MRPPRAWVQVDYYGVLGVDRSASKADIRRAYRDLARQCHPDTHPGDVAAENQFKDVAAAYQVLRDAGRRAEYDQVRAASDSDRRVGFGMSGATADAGFWAGHARRRADFWAQASASATATAERPSPEPPKVSFVWTMAPRPGLGTAVGVAACIAFVLAAFVVNWAPSTSFMTIARLTGRDNPEAELYCNLLVAALQIGVGLAMTIGLTTFWPSGPFRLWAAGAALLMAGAQALVIQDAAHRLHLDLVWTAWIGVGGCGLLAIAMVLGPRWARVGKRIDPPPTRDSAHGSA